VSWAKGSNKRGLGGDDVKLPPLPLPEAAGEPVGHWVRFNADPKGSWPSERGAGAAAGCGSRAARRLPVARQAAVLERGCGRGFRLTGRRQPCAHEWTPFRRRPPDMCLEVGLRVVASAGPPASWSMSLVEYGRAAEEGGARALARGMGRAVRSVPARAAWLAAAAGRRPAALGWPGASASPPAMHGRAARCLGRPASLPSSLRTPTPPTPAGKAPERDLSLVECGRPFYLEVQALDQYSNKCGRRDGSPRAGGLA
jgi:hypothetical protein